MTGIPDGRFSGILDDGMSSPGNDQPRRDVASREESIERRVRELERFRASIERLRRERQAAFDQFSALTRRREAGGGVPSREDDATTEPGVAAVAAMPAADPAPAEPPIAGPVPAEAAPGVIDGPPGAGSQSRAAGDAPSEPSSERPRAAAETDRAAEPAEPAGEATFADAASGLGRGRRPRWLFLLAAVVAAGPLAWWLWGPQAQRRTASPQAPVVPPAGKVSLPGAGAPAPQPASVEPASPAEPSAEPSMAESGSGAGAAAPGAPPRPLVVQIVTTRPVWVRAIADDETRLGRLVAAGETLTFDAAQAVSLRVGDAGAVRVIVNGRDRGSIGRDGQVQTVRFAVWEP